MRMIAMLALLTGMFTGIVYGEDAIKAEIFPVEYQQGSYSLCRRFPGVLRVSFIGNKAKAKGLKLVLDLPIGIKCIGATPFLPTDHKNLPADKMSSQKTMLDGAKYTRYTIAIPASIIKRIQSKGVAWKNNELVYIITDKRTYKKSKDTGRVFYQLLSDDFSASRRTFTLHVLPKISYPKIKSRKFGLLVAYLANLEIPFDDVRKSYLDYWTALSAKPRTFGFAGWGNINKSIRDEVRKRFDPMVIVARGTSPMLSGFNKYRFPLSVDATGHKTPGVVAPYYAIEDPDRLFWDEFVVNGIKEKMKAMPNPKGIIFDIEPGSDNGYSEINRKLFQKYAGFSSLPSIKDIRMKYAKRWFDFRVMQNQKIIMKISQMMKKHFSRIPFWSCSDPIHTGAVTLTQWCGVDVRLADEYVNIQANMPYYSGLQYFDDMEFNVKHLKKPNFPLIDPAENMLMFFKRYTPIKVGQNIIATAALGCKGIGFWPYDIFDGRYLQEISRAYSVIGEVDDYYANKAVDHKLSAVPVNVIDKVFKSNGKKFKISFPDFKKTVKAKLHKHGDDYVITLINYNEKNNAILKVKINDPALAGSKYRIYDITTGALLCKDGNNRLDGHDVIKGIYLSVPAGDYAVFEVTKNRKLYRKTLSQKKLILALNKEKERLAPDSKFPELEKDGAKITWGNISGGTTPELMFSVKERTVCMDAVTGGNIIACMRKNQPNSDLLKGDKSRGFLDELVLYDPAQKKVLFTIQDINITEGMPSVAFTYRIPSFDGANPVRNPLEGILITKRITLSKDGSAINVSYGFTNRNPQKNDVEFGFRIKNYPRLGAQIVGMKSLSQISEILYHSQKELKKITPGSPINNLVLSSDNKPAEWMKNIKITGLWDDGGNITIKASNEGTTKKLTLSPDKNLTAGFYSWGKRTGMFTIELLSKKITLPYNKMVKYNYDIKL